MTLSIISIPALSEYSDGGGGISLSSALKDLTITEPAIPRSTWWYQFPGFAPDHLAPLAQEFNRLARHMGWSPKGKAIAKHRSACYAEEFKTHFGDRDTGLQGWQEMCYAAAIEGVPSSITQCKKVLASSRVNLVNLVDTRRNPEIPLRMFRTDKAFREYTQGGQIFPKKAAKENRLLKVLLKHVF